MTLGALHPVREQTGQKPGPLSMGAAGSIGASAAMAISAGIAPPVPLDPALPLASIMQCQVLAVSIPANWNAADRAAPCPDDHVSAATTSQATLRLKRPILRVRDRNTNTPCDRRPSGHAILDEAAPTGNCDGESDVTALPVFLFRPHKSKPLQIRRRSYMTSLL